MWSNEYVRLCFADAIRPVDPPGMLLEAYLLSDPLSIFSRRYSKSQSDDPSRMHARKSIVHARKSIVNASMWSRGSDESKRTSASSRRGTMFSQQSQTTLDLIIRDHSVKALTSSELYCVDAKKLRDLILDVSVGVFTCGDASFIR